METKFPDFGNAAELLRMLTGKQVTAKVVREALTASPSGLVFAGLYVADGEEKPTAAVLIDFPLAVSVSGALASLPPGVVAEQIKAREVTDMLRSNVGEVLNIASSLYNESGSPHMRLQNIEELKGKAAGALAEFIGTPHVYRLDLEVTLPQCPPGKLTFIR